MKIPPAYAAWREALGFDEFNFGYSGIRVFPLSEVDEGQVGYSRAEDGRSFCDGAEGSWKPEWIVIGRDTLLGDPIMLDTSHPDLQVMTAMHGEGSWEPQPIAKSLQTLAIALRAIKDISVGREHPVALEQNPLSDSERLQVLQTIRQANNGEIGLDFWEGILEG